MSSKLLVSFSFLFTACLLTSCNTQKQDEDLAGVKHFYFEFVDEVQNELTIEIINKVSKNMVQYDYVMSEKSAAIVGAAPQSGKGQLEVWVVVEPSEQLSPP